MALPKTTDTPNGRRLIEIINAAPDDVMSKWPWPSEYDLKLMGGFINYYSCVDLALRRTIEVMELANMLPEKLNGKTAYLTIADVERAVLSGDWSNANRRALEELIEYRGTRNLMAHFVMRRFPNDDAYVFLTKSARDFKREMGFDPLPGMLMTAVVEIPQIKERLKTVHKLHNWLVKVTDEIEEQWLAKAKRKM